MAARIAVPRGNVAVLSVEALTLFGIALVHNLDRTIMSSLLQPIKLEFGLSDAATGALSGMAFGLAYATLGVPFARLADTADRRKLLGVAVALWSILTLVCGLSAGFWGLFAARLGVGICEAAGAPAMHALCADRFSSSRRSTAASLIVVGMAIGAIIGVTSGGFIADRLGWRAAFWLAGVPGLLLAPLAWRFLFEPRRTHAPIRLANLLGAGMLRAGASLLGKRGMRCLLGAAAAQAFWFWGTATWFITFLVRSHGMSLTQAAFGYGVVSGISTLIGILLNGWLGDRLVRRDIRWLGWLPASATLACLAFTVPVYLVGSGTVALSLYVIGNVFYGVISPAQFAATYAIAGTRARAMGVAMVSFVTYFIGLGVSATAIGAVSDILAARHGTDSLRLALLAANVTLPVAAAFYLRSTRWFATEATDE